MNLTPEEILEVSEMLVRHKNITEGLSMYEAQYMQMNEAYARVLNEMYDLEAKLKEVGL